MIRHVVVFNFKPDIEVSDQEWILEKIQGLGKVASVQNMEIGRLLEPMQDWYKPRMSADFRWVLTMLFKNEEALYAYQTDPYHASVAQEIRKRVSVIRVMDFVTIEST